MHNTVVMFISSSDELIIKIIIRTIDLDLRTPPLFDVIYRGACEVFSESIGGNSVFVTAAAELLCQIE